jgi:hypothetical protein
VLRSKRKDQWIAQFYPALGREGLVRATSSVLNGAGSFASGGKDQLARALGVAGRPSLSSSCGITIVFICREGGLMVASIVDARQINAIR